MNVKEILYLKKENYAYFIAYNYYYYLYMKFFIFFLNKTDFFVCLLKNQRMSRIKYLL